MQDQVTKACEVLAGKAIAIHFKRDEIDEETKMFVARHP